MERIDLKKGSDFEWLMAVMRKQNEIIDWINDHGEYVILKKPPKGQIWQLVER